MNEEDGLVVDVAVLSDRWDAMPEAEAMVRRAVAAALAHPEVAVGSDAELSVALADDSMLRRLNRDYRSKDQPTNVLSFPAVRGPLLGDVVIAYETLAREAAEERVPADHHLAHLTVHGLLHLLGHDHEDEAEAARMEALETAILGRLGMSDPHAGGRANPD